MQDDEVRSAIREFLETYVPDADFEDDEDIFELGLVNSLMSMQLVLFVEKNYGLQLQGDDLDLQNFRSVDRITQLVLGAT